MVTSKIETEKLVGQLKAHEPAALSTFYDLYSRALYNVVLRIVRSDEVAEDILQEGFVKVWMNVEAYDSEKGTIFTWALNIFRNLAIDHLRSSSHKHSLRSVSTDESVQFFADHGSFTQPDYIGIKELIMQLTPDQKRVVDMLYFEGFTHSEAAEQLNLPLGTVKTRARSAISALRKFFDHQQ